MEGHNREISSNDFRLQKWLNYFPVNSLVSPFFFLKKRCLRWNLIFPWHSKYQLWWRHSKGEGPYAHSVLRTYVREEWQDIINDFLYDGSSFMSYWRTWSVLVIWFKKNMHKCVLGQLGLIRRLGSVQVTKRAPSFTKKIFPMLSFIFFYYFLVRKLRRDADLRLWLGYYWGFGVETIINL